MKHESEPETESVQENCNGLAETLQYLESLKGKPGSLESLRHELSEIVAMMIPDFADAACVDCFQPNGATQRFAMFSHDRSVLASNRFELAYKNDAERCLRIALSDGIAFLGSLQVMRLPSAPAFSADERLDCKLLASRISARISSSVAERKRTDCDDGEMHSKHAEDDDPSDVRLHQICGVLAHEFRNPLSVFSTAVDLMQNDSQANEQLHGILKLQTERMTRLVDDLLDMSRHINGKTRLQKEPTPLQQIIDAAVQSTESTLAAKRQWVVTNIDPNPAWVDGDRFRLTQVLINLFSNASKFSEEGMPIRLSVARENDHIELQVSDDGIGIEPSDLPNVFEFFTQAQSANSIAHSSGGLGIGLGLVKTLVEMHDGRVAAHSDGKDRGSTFAVRLPLCDPVIHVVSTDEPSIPTKRQRVLIVDDRRENEFLLRALVKKLGVHETRSAIDGPSAIEALNEFHPDLILLDLGLPGMSGLELATEIRKLDQCRNTFIVALTGYDDAEMRQQAESAGVDLYRLKPASMEMLKDVFSRMSLVQS